MNRNTVAPILATLGLALLFASVFLAFREFAWYGQAELNLIPTVLATFVLSIVCLLTFLIINRTREI